MGAYSTKEAAKKLRIGWQTLIRWMAEGKVKRPQQVGKLKIMVWADADIARVKRQMKKLYHRSKRRPQKKGKRQ